MKHFLPLSICWLLATSGFSQDADSVFIKQVDSLIQVSKTLTSARNYEEAHRVNEEAMALSFQALGDQHASYADCLFNKGRIFHFSKNYEEAEREYVAAEKIQAKTLGTDHIVYSKTLNNLAILKRTQGQFDLAESYFLKVKTIQESSRGKYHPDNTSVINSLGILYLNSGKFEEAEKMYLEVKEIRGRAYGEEDTRYADILENLGQLYWTLGQFDRAETAYLQAKEIKKKALGEDDLDYAQLLNNVAVLYSDSKRLEAAERLYLEAMKVQEAKLGKEHSDYAVSLGNLGLLNVDLGKYEEAEAILLEAKNIWEKIAGKESLEYASALDYLASLYFRIGLFDSAEPLYYESLEIKEKLESEAAAMAVSYNNLAVVHMEKGKFEKAEPLLVKAKEKVAQTTGKETNDYAWCLNNLGILYDKMGKVEESASHFLEANQVRKKALGEDHPDYANGLEDLAALYQKTGKTEEALQLHLTAKSIFEKAFGKSHPRYEECISNLATFYRKEGNAEAAYPLVLEANALQQQLLLKSAKHLSEQELAARVAAFGGHLDELFSMPKNGKANDPGLLYQNTLFYNGFLLNAALQVRRMARRNEATTLQFERLTAIHRRLGDLYAMPADERAGTEALEQQANDIEKEIVKNVSGVGAAIQQVTWQEVQAKLKVGEAAIEFVRFNDLWGSGDAHYGALILKPDGEPAYIALCSEAALDSLFVGSTERRGDYVSGLYGSNDRGAVALEQPKRTLYELLWQPMEGSLEGVSTIHFAAAGMIHRLNLGAIGISRRESLADKYTLNLLGSTRQLVYPSDLKITNQDAVVFGAVQYDIDTVYINSDQFDEDMLASRNRARSRGGFAFAEPSVRGRALSYLDWTEDEIIAVEASLVSGNMKPIVSQGISATEEVFKEISITGKSPRLLHVATHGFFFPDPKTSLSAKTDDMVFKTSDNPMLRSGLILAGGNHAWMTGKSYRPDMEDGILTAYEISQMDLSNTELVVLSACETGLGDIAGSEGVYGLQRALKIAGAKYIVMSLWQVPDRETKEFMATFYRHWMEEEMTIPDAFQKTQREMKDRFYDPYNWAGFVLME